MEDLFDALLFGDDLSAEERSSIQARLDDDPTLAAAWAHWCEVRRRLRSGLREHVSDRRLLVLYVLDEEGLSHALTREEREALAEARDDIARAIETIPALEQIVDRIRDDRAEFEDVWARHSAGAGEMLSREADASEDEARPTRAPARADRAARPARARDRSFARRWSRRLAVAALVVGLAAIAVLFWPGRDAPTRVTVAEGAVKVEDLGDRGTVRLIGPATLSYRPAEGPPRARAVRLETGRAFFDVQPRNGTSFVVETRAGTAAVLGTQFGVTTRADTTEVVLASGSVRVEGTPQAGRDGVVLEPGEYSRVTKGGAPASPTSVDLTDALEWTGLFVFRAMPLETIVERLSRRYDAEIAVAESLAGEAVTGTFEREQPVTEVLGALAATLGAEVEKVHDNRYRLVPGRSSRGR